jgi:wyosine [tRNA(Phe)-imidazoG37] synthetase (radical SAM superfamily)
MVSKAKQRARQKGLPFDLKYTDFEIPECCPLLGIKLEWNTGEPKKFSPSLDRIVPSKGYVKDNVWVISTRANKIKNDASPEELLLLAKSLATHLGIPIH